MARVAPFAQALEVRSDDRLAHVRMADDDRETAVLGVDPDHLDRLGLLRQRSGKQSCHNREGKDVNSAFRMSAKDICSMFSVAYQSWKVNMSIQRRRKQSCHSFSREFSGQGEPVAIA